ncbi:PREDICTED: TM2 domain-containing protein CG10795-like [Acropora digitifera]|uniref:TM2 domain-containing protein CG10795-like n=1 Tax=Acropora digitifera TaxID=70779 RepID=UPI00077AB7A7|nr:PREDICTED: TM2 domain-containing protein CG10795-like [Acropora digitifera]
MRAISGVSCHLSQFLQSQSNYRLNLKFDLGIVSGVKCKAAAVSKDGENITSCIKNVSCQYTNGHSYETALLLSVFLGMFGIDRFYLGYPAIGLLKFCTLGFFFVFHLVDIVLIATQVVGPADGSSYIIDYYGPRLTHISKNMFTYYKPED